MKDFTILITVFLSTVTAYLDKPYAPKFLPTATNVTFHVGELAKLPCVIANLGEEQTVAWRKLPDVYPLTIGQMTYTPDVSYSLDYVNAKRYITEWNLLIRNVQPEHGGKYECQVTTQKGLKRHVRLNVIAIILSGTQYVHRSEQIRLQCNVTGNVLPPDDIDWYKNGRLLHSDYTRGIVITKYRSRKDRTLYSELVIDNTSPRHSGTYVCESSDLEIAELPVYVLAASAVNVKRGTSAFHVNSNGKKREKNNSKNCEQSVFNRQILTHSFIFLFVIQTLFS